MTDTDVVLEILAGVTPARPIATQTLKSRLCKRTGKPEKQAGNFLEYLVKSGFAGVRLDGPQKHFMGRTVNLRLWFDPSLATDPLPPLEVSPAAPAPARHVVAGGQDLELHAKVDAIASKLGVTPLQTDADQIETLRADRNRWFETANFWRDRANELEAEIAELKGGE